MYDAKPATGGGWFSCCRRRSKTAELVLGSQIAIEVKNLSKKFNQGKKKEVVAIDDLSLSIPKNGVYVVLGGAIFRCCFTHADSSGSHHKGRTEAASLRCTAS